MEFGSFGVVFERHLRHFDTLKIYSQLCGCEKKLQKKYFATPTCQIAAETFIHEWITFQPSASIWFRTNRLELCTETTAFSRLFARKIVESGQNECRARGVIMNLIFKAADTFQVLGLFLEFTFASIE